MEFVKRSPIRTSISVGSERKRKGQKGILGGTDGAQYGADESGAVGGLYHRRVNSIVCLADGDGSSTGRARSTNGFAIIIGTTSRRPPS
ncbi:hypothetical protein PG985_016388 [Apiospora marii]|uniref:Uncharacterized protein n=1 Tax=Apiospora marii TaxID=335849 RepID=A0ABR1R411_9PEZI